MQTQTQTQPTIDHQQALNLFWQVSRSFHGRPAKGKPLTVEQAFKKLNQGLGLTHAGNPVFWKLTGLMSQIIYDQDEGDEVASINE